jgi:putative redox protein
MAIMKKIAFPGIGGDLLAARLELPNGKPKAFALFAHCFTCGKDIVAARRIAEGLTDLGFAVLRFDFTGLGSSEGDFANTNFSSNVGDLLQAAFYLRNEHEAPSLLVGHSLGGSAVLAAAGQIPEVKAVATIGAPSDPGHVAHLFTEAQSEIEAEGEAEVVLAGRSFRIQKQFLEDIENQKLTEAIGAMRKPLMVFHSPFDDTVDIDSAAEIFMAAKHPKSFVSLDDADHLLSRREDAAYVATLLAAWAERYLPKQEIEDQREEGVVVVRETGQGKFQNEVLNGPHRMVADEPVSVGGDATGPTPYGYLLAGLGSCTSMTIRMYAERKKWPLTNVSVTLRHHKIHATDCADCETRDGKVDRIDRELAFEGNLDAEQRSRLLEIADKCPVHRTLHSEVKIVSTLRD